MCSIGEKNKALIWNMQTDETNAPVNQTTPHLEYESPEEVINIAWTHSPWIAIACQRKLQMLKFY